MRFLSIVLLIKAALMLFVIGYSGIGLGPDEAQYWTWSRHLDFGYYSKPPGIAWEIAFGTSLFGATEMGVRFGAVVLGTLFAFAVYFLAKEAKLSENRCIVAALLAAFTPLGIFSTFLAITDGGMLLFWTLGLLFFIRERRSYLLIGLMVACGALFKWPIYLLWVLLLPFGYKSWKFYLGVAISFLGLLPTVYWNVGHDWATFKHVTTIVQGGNDGGSSGNPLDFIGSQVAILSPVVFILLMISWFKLPKQSSQLFFLGASSLAILLAFIVYSFFKKGQGNWCLFAYPGAFVYLAGVWDRKGWMNFALAVSVAVTALIFLVPLPWKMNPFRHNLGWNEFKKLPFDQAKQFLLADKYQITSILSFYNPTQQDAYFFNILGTRKNQFSYWGGLDKEKGKDAIFVVVETAPQLDEKLDKLSAFYTEKLAPYFEKVDQPTRMPLFSYNGQTVKSALIFHATNYNGTAPQDPEKY